MRALVSRLMTGGEQAIERVARRVRELLARYDPPDFGHVPDPDSAIFLCAIDHRTGYTRAHVVAGEGPLEGSALMWARGLGEARRRPGLLTAPMLLDVSGAEVAAIFAIEGETVADPERRAQLWRDLATGLALDYAGTAETLLGAADGRLGGDRGLLARLSRLQAYADPLEKKSQLFAKICERRGWFEVADPDRWEVSADNVLMRLALRSGLVAPGELDEVRAATREAFKRVAAGAAISPPLLDDLLWELGRQDADLLGAVIEVSEPPREPGSTWY